MYVPVIRNLIVIREKSFSKVERKVWNICGFHQKIMINHLKNSRYINVFQTITQIEFKSFGFGILHD